MPRQRASTSGRMRSKRCAEALEPEWAEPTRARDRSQAPFEPLRRSGFASGSGAAKPSLAGTTDRCRGRTPERDGGGAHGQAWRRNAATRATRPLSHSSTSCVGHRRTRAPSGGDAKTAQRRQQGSNVGWTITVEPDGWGEIAISLPGGRACTETGAICTADNRMLSNSPNATVQGPAALSVADASAHENTDDALEFAVSLDRASTLTVTVEYATSNGSCTPSRASARRRAGQGSRRRRHRTRRPRPRRWEAVARPPEVEPHWKRQAYGPRRSRRRWIVIDRYERGPAPEDDQIVVTRLPERRREDGLKR